ncbi:MAG: DNA alkylation repair protein [Planctomycetota bacterium]
MAEPFKNLIRKEVVVAMASHLRRVSPAFPKRSFVERASHGLDALELKARVAHVADSLAEALPASFEKSVAVLEKSLAPARADDDLGKLVISEGGLAGWAIWPMTDYVARYGLAHPARALRALRLMTQRNTAEYAIRPFLVEHNERTMRELKKWLTDKSPHVRRLVSEGTRPRLPWGMQLKSLMADPSPSLPLLEALQDDPSAYVRRSVANHLNDIAKDHPDVVAAWVARFLPAADANREALLRHASRTLIKKADRKVLSLWGLGKALRGEADLRITPRRPALGSTMELSVVLRSTAKQAQDLVVDYVVHHVRKAGTTSAKTWKGWRCKLAVGEERALTKRHSWKPVTTRRDYPGLHRVELVINGSIVATDEVKIVPSH